MRRLIVAHVEAFQQGRVQAGKIRESHLISVRAAGLGPDALNDVIVGDSDLGLDSLDRLDLVMGLTRYFGFDATGVEDYLLVRRRIGDWVDLALMHFDRIGHEAAITFATSGSTGQPKSVRHGKAVLESEIAALRQGPLAALCPENRIIALVPPHHIYGFLWTVLLPQMCGSGVVDLSWSPPSSLFRALRPGDLVVATPFGLEMLARTGKRVTPGVTGASSGGPTTSATWAAARDLGLETLLEIYGSSETGGVGWRSGGDRDFALIGDIDLRGGVPHRLGLALDLQDCLDWTGPRTFRVLGRKDNVVQVAGSNVNLDRLRKRFLDRTGALDAAIRLGAGNRLKAFIAIDAGTEQDVRAALDGLMQSLPAAERPSDIRFGPALPRTALGKLSDW